ncbi:MAG: asparagine synthase-related protein [Gemmatimonadaceae bacterium]
MSGIVGILHLDGAPVDERLLGGLTEFMAYRGPDARETWTRGNIGFGHAMFRTTDEAEHERQPCTLDGEVWITADARVDARADLLRELRGAGRRVAAAVTDPELILHAYHAWGDECVHHLLGDFAFAIWDGRERRLFCARDPFGVKLFYYSLVGGVCVLSNTLEVVRRHPAVSDRLNEHAIGDFLLVGYNAELDTTFFGDVQRIPPAHVLSVRVGTGRVTVRRYWSFPTPAPIRYRRDAEYVEHFRELLSAAVGDRMRTDQVGIYLSGGLDSTMLAATAKELLARRAGGELRAHTSVLTHLDDEELPFTRMVAERLSIPLECHPADRRAPLESWDGDARLLRPEPVDEPDLPVFVESTAAMASHARVALYGEDGDALFSAPSLRAALGTAELPAILWRAARYLVRARRVPRLGFGLRSFWRPRGASCRGSAPEPFPAWIRPEFADRLDLRNRHQELIRERPLSSHPTRPEVEARLTAPVWQSFMESLDPGVTRLPVIIRLPLLDTRLIAYVVSIPAIPWCQHKELARVAMQGILPEPVLRRPKSGLPVEFYAARLRHAETRGTLPREFAPPTLAYVRVTPVHWTGGGEVYDLWYQFRAGLLDRWLRRVANTRSPHSLRSRPNARELHSVQEAVR